MFKSPQDFLPCHHLPRRGTGDSLFIGMNLMHAWSAKSAKRDAGKVSVLCKLAVGRASENHVLSTELYCRATPPIPARSSCRLSKYSIASTLRIRYFQVFFPVIWQSTAPDTNSSLALRLDMWQAMRNCSFVMRSGQAASC